MEKTSFNQEFLKLQIAFGYNAKPEMSEVYYQEFSYLSDTDWTHLIREALHREERWPRIATLRKILDEVRFSKIEENWNHIKEQERKNAEDGFVMYPERFREIIKALSDKHPKQACFDLVQSWRSKPDDSVPF